MTEKSCPSRRRIDGTPRDRCLDDFIVKRLVDIEQGNGERDVHGEEARVRDQDEHAEENLDQWYLIMGQLNSEPQYSPRTGPPCQ